MIKVPVKFQKDRYKTVGGVALTRFPLQSRNHAKNSKLTRKSVHRTRMPHAKCHSEKGFICNCNRYTMKLLLRPGHSLLYGTKSREDNSETKNARVVFLVHDTSSQCDACTCKVSWMYSIWFRSYSPDTVNYMELSQGEIIQKPKMPELSSLFMTHRLNVMHAPV